MKTEKLVLTFSVESFSKDLVDNVGQGLEWGSSIGIALTASLLAISLIHYLFYRSQKC